MEPKTMTAKIERLENRVTELERRIKSSSYPKANSIMKSLKDRLKQQRYHQQKERKAVLDRTYGKISKKHANDILKHIATSRKLWK